MADEKTSPRVLKIAAKVRTTLSWFSDAKTLADLPLKTLAGLKCADIVSMAQSLTTQAKDRPRKTRG